MCWMYKNSIRLFLFLNLSLKFLKITEILPASDKTLGDARGYVIADYQDQLERQWVDELRKSYKVNINQEIFESLIK